ncbi:hypothetical protein M885DRAFT_142758 [Pelagophyceae sp. CCMP2097]|nr:hypothetical protein M885DRAFT_142758 [Pelagophyceae sp. CCMP2097]
MELRRLASAAPTPARRTFTSLSPSQVELEERLRTCCLFICAAGVVAYGLARLKFALVPLLLSLSLKYVLQPLIDALTGRARAFEDEEKRDASQKSKSRLSTALITIQRRLRRIALPHSVAVFVALWITLSCLALLAAVVAESVRDFTSRADEYAEQVKSFLVRALRWLDNNGIDKRWRKPQTLEKVADRLELSSWVTAFVFSLYSPSARACSPSSRRRLWWSCSRCTCS